jgi:hypothetical protein
MTHTLVKRERERERERRRDEKKRKRTVRAVAAKEWQKRKRTDGGGLLPSSGA